MSDDEDNVNHPEAGNLGGNAPLDFFAGVPVGDPAQVRRGTSATPISTSDRSDTEVAALTRGRLGANRRRQNPTNFTITETTQVDTIDPRYTREQRAAEEAVVGHNIESGHMAAQLQMQQAQLQMQQADREAQQAADEQRRLQAAEREHDQALSRLSDLNRGVMEQRIDPARFFTNNRGAGLGAAASVALGVLGQGLNPNLSNTAMVIIDRAISRDVEAQINDMQNQQQGVVTARNLYGDLLNTFRNEGAAREALRGMYLAEMERRVQALTDQTSSVATARQADRLMHDLRKARADANVAAARAERTVVMEAITKGSSRPGSPLAAQYTAASMRGNMPITATAFAGLAAEQGLLGQQPQAQQPQAQLPPQQEQISSGDLRSSEGTRVTPAQVRNAAAPTTPRTSSGGTRAQRSSARRAARSAYRDGLSAPGGVVGRLQPIRDQARNVYMGYVDLHGAIPHETRGGASRTPVFIPRSAPGGGLIAISRDGTQRVVQIGDRLTQGERLMGTHMTQHTQPSTAVNRRNAAEMAAPISVGNGLFATPTARVEVPNFETAVDQMRTSMRLHRLASTAIRFLRDRPDGARLSLRSMQGEAGGRAGVNAIQLMGVLAQEGSLGTLQQGEREALQRYTQMMGPLEDLFTHGFEKEQALGAFSEILRGARAGRESNPLSGYLFRRGNRTADEIVSGAQE